MLTFFAFAAVFALGFGAGRIHNKKAVEAKIEAAVAAVKAKL